jgi:hypothetical protein
MRVLASTSVRRRVRRHAHPSGRCGENVPRTADEHLLLEDAFTQCAGQWVAIDRKTGRIVAAKPSPCELSAYVKERLIRGVDIIRAPAENEPEVVGFG